MLLRHRNRQIGDVAHNGMGRRRALSLASRDERRELENVLGEQIDAVVPLEDLTDGRADASAFSFPRGPASHRARRKRPRCIQPDLSR